MTLTFKEMLENYAVLLVRHGLNIQPGQPVNIGAEACQRDFALLVAAEAYKAGASFVNLDLTEPRLARERILHSKDEDLSYIPGYVSAKYKEFVDTTAANLRIIGMEYPDIMSDLDPKKINKARIAQYQAMKYYYQNGIEKSRVHWTVAAASTAAWGKKLFPTLAPEEAEKRLWNEIFKICRVDSADYLTRWRTHNTKLQKRCVKLNEIKIKTLHFKGPGTDLKVGLSEYSIFKGGSDKSPRDVEFEPNIPTEECFTTPDFRMTEGHVRATRPFLVNGRLIKGLKMSFKSGELVDFEADEGCETFREYINSDAGGRRLGEVALVGIDSPVYQSGIVFEEILFDENAACHIAVGVSYKFCLRGGETMSEEELQSVGANQSSVHTDMMISSEEVDVFAITYSGETIEIIRKGKWVEL